MCWPQLVGDLEIKERRPRTWNEPRYKRLSFVRGGQRDSDEWSPRPRRLTEQEIWERRRLRALDPPRFEQPHPHPHQQLAGWHDPRIMPLQPHPQQTQHCHHPAIDQHGNHGHQQIDHHSHHSDSIIATEDHGNDDDDHHHPRPRLICIEPPRSRLPRGYETYVRIPPSSSEDSNSSHGSSGFAEGFRAGRRSLSRRAVRRGRSRSRFTDDSFEDLTQPRHRSRSRGGRRQ